MYLSLSTLSFETGLSQNSELTDWLGWLLGELQRVTSLWPHLQC